MNRTSLQACISILLGAQLSLGMGGSPIIGTILTRGPFELDHSQVTGNATLFDGSTVRTGKASSELLLNGGSKVRLASESVGRVYRDHLVLEKGQGQLEASGTYGLEAHNLRLLPEAGDSTARVVLVAANRVQMQSLKGTFHVTNVTGMLLARLDAGEALVFDQPEGATATTKITGKLLKRDGHFFVTDEATKVTVQLEGSIPDSRVGKRVEVTGVAGSKVPAAGASRVISIISLKVVTGAISTTAIITGVTVAAAAAVGAGVVVLRDQDEKPAASR